MMGGSLGISWKSSSERIGYSIADWTLYGRSGMAWNNKANMGFVARNGYNYFLILIPCRNLTLFHTVSLTLSGSLRPFNR